jgi:hypothetical protein
MQRMMQLSAKLAIAAQQALLSILSRTAHSAYDHIPGLSLSIPALLDIIPVVLRWMTFSLGHGPREFLHSVVHVKDAVAAAGIASHLALLHSRPPHVVSAGGPQLRPFLLATLSSLRQLLNR